MKRDNSNIIDLAARRSTVGRQSRLSEADDLLLRLRNTKRLSKTDQATLVGNLGQLISEVGHGERMAIALALLEKNEYEKRKRYIRFPDENVGQQARYAASGGSFARIVDRLIQWRAEKDGGQDQAKVDYVRKIFRGTSFLPPSPFRLRGHTDRAEAIQFEADMRKVFDKLAEEADLTDFFALLSKYPIFPSEAWYQWTDSLQIVADHDPNTIPMSDWDPEEEDDELRDYIPWWAPKCIVGQWYIPFDCKRIRIPAQEATTIRSSIADASGRADDDFFDLILPFMNPNFTGISTVYHRLPVWLIALPQHDRLVPCLYIPAQSVGGFYPNQTFPLSGHPTLPSFVENLGQSHDAQYIPDFANDELNTLYVHVSSEEIFAIGSHIDDSVTNFRDDLMFVDMEHELPEWLRERSVKRILALSANCDAAMHFAFSPRTFFGKKWDRGDGTIFRSSFFDSVHLHLPGPSQDTVAAYLLRNMIGSDGPNIFDALKIDAVSKHSAARTFMNAELSKFRRAFEERYESKPR